MAWSRCRSRSFQAAVQVLLWYSALVPRHGGHRRAGPPLRGLRLSSPAAVIGQVVGSIVRGGARRATSACRGQCGG
jgi:hypothetical protein